MPIKHYGIYLAYPPAVDMRDQGLGRYLAMFLKGAEGCQDVRFTIVCPSWSRETLKQLLASEQVPLFQSKVVCPEGKPYVLRVFEAFKRLNNRPSKRRLSKTLAETAWSTCRLLLDQMATRLVSAHNFATLAGLVAYGLLVLVLLTPILLLALPFAFLGLLGLIASRLLRHVKVVPHRALQRFRSTLATLLAFPQRQTWVLRLFDEMQRNEIRRMHETIKSMTDVRAWYCPTAFWPSFNDISGPKLMCVPDVVLKDFPVAYSAVGGDRFFNGFKAVEQAIRNGDHYITYSESVKWNTLVDRYAVRPTSITVVPHAHIKLNRLVDISGFPDVEKTSEKYCHVLLTTAMQRSSNPAYTTTFANESFKFIFYASQFRPNKNVITLLRAFDTLVRKRYLGHKLILTGDPADMPEIQRFVSARRLNNDVIFLNRLSVSELAACYKLADIVVNPSLSEGGCPFTFSEALSVGTPVVMSRIAVAEEVLTNPNLQEITFFDPYSWQDCAARIEWGIVNRKQLLETQLSAYDQLSKRTWKTVVEEHVKVLDRIAAQAAQ